MVVIRADGNSIIGMGHIMRCLSIADAMKDKPLFVCACGECRQPIEARGYKVIVLPTDYRHMESELPLFKKILDENKAADDDRLLILVDSYQITDQYIYGLKRFAYVVCMEDMGISYPADLLINYNLYGPEMAYAEGLRTLLGTAYVPLRKEFAKDCTYEVRTEVEKVLITTGGGDPCFAASGLLDKLLEATEKSGFGHIVFYVISGPVNRYARALKEKYGEHPRVKIYENITHIEEVMACCDVVMTAAGSTVYEVCALGIPMICFYFAENQRRGAECLAGQTAIVNAGNYAKETADTVSHAWDALKRCILEPSYRKELSRQERQLVDGRGAMRIAGELSGMRQTEN